jgi:hypothetical protein
MEMVRINTRISKEMNDWLDNETARTGVPKSTLIYLALEQYVSTKQAITTVGVIDKLMDKIAGIEQRLTVDKN